MVSKRTITICIQIVLFIFSIPIACSGGSMDEQKVHYEKYADVPDDVWEKFSNTSFYFGHQSVGFNILDGVNLLIEQNGKIPLTIEETENPTDYKPGVFMHSRIGQNKKPMSKLNGFIHLVSQGGRQNADVMFFKFCYIDFNAETDVKALFNDYQKAFEQLKQANPKTQFVHLTAPLTTVQTGPRAWIKKLIGREIKGIQENIKRHEFNELLRATYAGQEPIFDLAAIESTFPDGSRSTYEVDGKTFYSLVPNYTLDGGHLNEEGQLVIGEHLLLTLANLV